MVSMGGEPAGRDTTPKPKQRLGFLRGRARVPDDFDRMGEDEIRSLFERDQQDDPEAGR